MSNENPSPVLSLLGLARRAGRLSPGFDAAAESIKRGTAKVVLLAGDVSPRTAKKIEAAAVQSGVPVHRLAETMQQAGAANGKKSAGFLAVNDDGFARKLSALCAAQ